jgi:hypothetical protein
MNRYIKDPTVWLDGAIPPTPVSHHPSQGMYPHSLAAYPPLEFFLGIIFPCKVSNLTQWILMEKLV